VPVSDVIRLEDVSCGYSDISVLNGLSLNVGEGEAVALLGANGSGKTTTVRLISGMLQANRGLVSLFGRPSANLSSSEVARRGISHVPEGRALFPSLSVRENLIVGSFGGDGRRSTVMSGIERVITLFPWIGNRLNQPAGTLSGGQQQMVAIGRGLMSSPKVLMLDEPSLGLSPKMVGEVFDKLHQIREERVAIVLVEQNVTHALRLVERGYVLNHGRVVLEASAKQLVDDYSRLQRAYLS
jgi:branched-chain amino acid transport system ATP-binding protein